MEIRRARRTDLPFIRKLLADTLAESVPAVRDIPNERIENMARTEVNLEDMLAQRRQFAFLVAVEDDIRAGFLILEFHQVEETTGEVQSVIYHMAVTPEFLGRRVDRLLVSEAARVTHRRGIRYMVGRISASNRRALLAAMRQGFELERHQLVMACGPEGGERMPGRPDHEKAHDVRRAIQRKQKRETRH
jgi:GNAT superfamily N-acetyltransferase